MNFLIVTCSAFPVLKQDSVFSVNSLGQADRITLSALLIQQRYHSQAPWPLAQEGSLQKIENVNL